MRKYKIGDKVQIRTWLKRPSHWNSDGRMDHWQGKIVIIRDFNGYNDYLIIEDRKERPGGKCGWVWEESDFIPINYDYLEDDLFTMD